MAWFSAHVELGEKREPSDEFHARMARWHGAVGTSPRGWLDAQISIEAESILHATEVAQLVVTRAAREAGDTDATPVAIEVMTEAEHHARDISPTLPEMVDARDAADILGVSRQRVQQIVDTLGGVKVGNSWAFPRSAVEEYVRAHARG